MKFGRNLNMHTVFIDDKKKYDGRLTDEMDLIFDNLLEFAQVLQN